LEFRKSDKNKPDIGLSGIPEAPRSFFNQINIEINDLGMRSQPSFVAAVEAAPVPNLIPMKYQACTNAYILGFKDGYAFCKTTKMYIAANFFVRQPTLHDAAYAEGWYFGQSLADTDNRDEFYRKAFKKAEDRYDSSGDIGGRSEKERRGQ